MEEQACCEDRDAEWPLPGVSEGLKEVERSVSCRLGSFPGRLGRVERRGRPRQWESTLGGRRLHWCPGIANMAVAYGVRCTDGL